jgi:hypothetical protein
MNLGKETALTRVSEWLGILAGLLLIAGTLIWGSVDQDGVPERDATHQID